MGIFIKVGTRGFTSYHITFSELGAVNGDSNGGGGEDCCNGNGDNRGGSHLRLVAFSREPGKPKRCVQDLTLKNGKVIVSTIFEREGAILVCGGVRICGGAHFQPIGTSADKIVPHPRSFQGQMAADLKKTFYSLFAENLGFANAEGRITQLQLEGRYQEEIFG